MNKVALFVLVFFKVLTQPIFSSDILQVSILTQDPGKELYAQFGHSAIRIKDDSLNTDDIYNFGMFDFSTPHFYLKFVKGNLDYFLAVYDYNRLLRISAMEERTIYEQVLNLSNSEKKTLQNLLNTTYRSDAKYYKYKFYEDNCATRIRDFVEMAQGERMSYDTSQYCCKTYRELLQPLIVNNYWINLGINLTLGSQADQLAPSRNFMFLPVHVYDIFEASGLVETSDVLISYGERKGSFTDYIVLIVVIALTLLFYFILGKRKLVMGIYISVFGIVGAVLAILTFFSNNPPYLYNWNVVWLLFPMFIALIPNINLKTKLKYFYISILSILIVFQTFIFKGFSNTFLPWLILMFLFYATELELFKKVKLLIKR